jgi:NitT/TauT family transport system substrate-binding protein
MTTSFTGNRRDILKGAAAAVGFSMPTIISSRGFAQSGTKTVNVQLPWFLNNEFAGDVVAKRLGYFDDEKLNVNLIPGGPNIDPVPLVASGKYQIGQQSSSPNIMLAAAQGIPVKSFAVALQVHPFAYFSLIKNPIKTPQDMIGKKVGVQPAGGDVLLKALLAKNNVPLDKVQIVLVGGDTTPLLTGQVDAIAAWRINAAQIKPLGKDYVTLPLWDFGVKLLPLPYFATADNLQKNADMYAGYLRAAGKGWAYALANPDKAVDLLLKQDKNLNHDTEMAGMNLVKNYGYSDLTKTKGWGEFDPAVWQDEITMFDQLKQFSNGAPKLGDVMTTAILDATNGQRPLISAA